MPKKYLDYENDILLYNCLWEILERMKTFKPHAKKEKNKIPIVINFTDWRASRQEGSNLRQRGDRSTRRKTR